MLQKRMHELDSMRNEIRRHEEYLMREDDESPELGIFMNRYAEISEEYAQVSKTLEHSSIRFNEMKMRMMDLEKEVAHRIKFIEQESSEDS